MHSPKNKDFYKLIENVRSQKEQNLPFVIYQKPNDVTVKCILPSTAKIVYTQNFTESGFIFSPFIGLDKTIVFANYNSQEAIYLNGETKTQKKSKLIKSGREAHLKLISKALKRIEEDKLKKVVVSRKITTKTQKQAFNLFEQLLNIYPNAFKYLWFHPKVGMWLGATPETLLKVTKGILFTTSLAGTLPVVADEYPNWSAKEVDEQQLVTDYILAALSNGITNINVTKASSIKAGELWHLKSMITGNLMDGVSLAEIIKKIHPTPAVCGLPKETAKEFLINHEGYHREFYTGFLGELNVDSTNNTHLYVNLRCMKLNGKMATIFIGGGITKESIAESEWNETQHKSKTMLNLL